MTPVAVVRSGRTEPVDDDWGGVLATITLVPPMTAEALTGLDAFSHVEVVFLFHGVPEDGPFAQSRHPRGNPEWPRVGIFAQRAKDRPNRIGLCTCEIVSVAGTELVVRGLDAIDGTPVLDLKPFMREFAPRATVRQPDWATALMGGYW